MLVGGPIDFLNH